MIRHIVAWNFKENANPKEDGAKIKALLEGLAGKIDGLLEIKVHTNLLDTSNRAIVLNSLFANEEALAAYKPHPEHVRAAEFIGTVATDRICVDYYE
ncbi:MAG: Dabb family protein [Defluviitaleaceae bacterium]|nr:Dabb family protein [Defluviitaleaceae bacterium]